MGSGVLFPLTPALRRERGLGRRPKVLLLACCKRAFEAAGAGYAGGPLGGPRARARRRKRIYPRCLWGPLGHRRDGPCSTSDKKNMKTT